ncbi:unnamed protein product [Zymoseptoria tritici ST99CH_1E4]|uniref:Acyltransferase 3 domain-containing protein n=1 Tax=Zymoseptoria tritici ST99CH_1E4 TaxID=1276532 RepID=A0A2H1GZZ5_ZYMTR|nr:unnamed protein product [Zymoseptoria tritici ST99CH_1E4]
MGADATDAQDKDLAMVTEYAISLSTADEMELEELRSQEEEGLLTGRLDAPKTKARRFLSSLSITTIFNYPEAGVELRPTAWLDGLRGLAAFEVFLFHYLDDWPVDKRAIWGPSKEDGHKPGVLYMPLVRSLLFSGDTAVCMFFAISGYVLSHRMLVMISDRKQEGLLPVLSSSLFRRGTRLYLPVLVQTFVLMLAIRLLGFPKPSVWPSAPTFLAELQNWFVSFIHLLMPLRFPERFEQLSNRYDGGISWTIPLEMYGSLQIYLAILALAYVSSHKARRLLLAIWIVISAMRDDWISGQFLLGLSFADYQIQRQRDPPAPSSWQKWRPAFLAVLFALGFYTAGMPSVQYEHEEYGAAMMKTRPGFTWLNLPQPFTDLYMDFQVDRMQRCLAAWACLIAIGELPFLRKCCEWRFVQYLGRISFGLYLCHIWVRPCLNPLAHLTCGIFGIDSENKTGSLVPLAWVLYFIPSAGINFIVAGLFERYLDRPSIQAGKKLEKFFLSWK